MNRKIAVIIVTSLVIFALSSVYFYLFYPVQFAIKGHQLKEKNSYFLVAVQKSTAAQWVVIGDEKGLYPEPKDAILTGNYPRGFGYDIETGGNTFVCYGQYLGEEKAAPGRINAKYQIYGWDILYPVKRGFSFFLLPKSGICRFDK